MISEPASSNTQSQRASRWAVAHRPIASLATVLIAVACLGCQALLPSALPNSLAWGADAKIASKAKADSFPSPADVGLTQATSVP